MREAVARLRGSVADRLSRTDLLNALRLLHFLNNVLRLVIDGSLDFIGWSLVLRLFDVVGRPLVLGLVNLVGGLLESWPIDLVAGRL